MLTGGAVVLSAVLAVAGEAQFEVGGRFETRVGQAPTGVTQDASGATVPAEQGQVLLIATPTLGLHYFSDLDDLRATSSTRILWRPSPLPRARPLVLQSLDLTETGVLSKRSRWRLSLRGAWGEEDYTSLSQQFVSQPSLPSALTVLLINGNGEITWRATRRTDMAVQFLSIHRRTLDIQASGAGTGEPAGPRLAFPTQTTASISPGIIHRLTRHRTLDVSATVADTNVGGTGQGISQVGQLNLLALQPQVGLRQQLGRSHQLHVSAGLNYAIALRRSEQAQSFPPLLPLLQVDLKTILRRLGDLQWRSIVGAATHAFADPVLGTEVLRATAQARLDIDVGTRWGVGALGIFATDVTGPLRPIGATAVAGTPSLAPDETLVSVEIPFRYRRPDQLVVELGARFSQRAPHLQSPGFAWRTNSREIWLFFSASTLPRSARRPSVSVEAPSRSAGATQDHPRTIRPAPPPVPSPL